MLQQEFGPQLASGELVLSSATDEGNTCNFEVRTVHTRSISSVYRLGAECRIAIAAFLGRAVGACRLETYT